MARYHPVLWTLKHPLESALRPYLSQPGTPALASEAEAACQRVVDDFYAREPRAAQWPKPAASVYVDTSGAFRVHWMVDGIWRL